MAGPARPRLRLDAPAHPRACTETYPGSPEQMPLVRAFLARVLQGCPAAADVTLMAHELAVNAVLHSRSGEPGGLFTLRVEVFEGEWVRVEVADEGGPVSPFLRTGLDDGSDGGRGLWIVDGLACEWGVSGDVIGRTVWFRVSWGAPAR